MAGSKEKLKGDKFVSKVPTSLVFEQPSKENKFLAENIFIQGFPLVQLCEGASFSETLFILLKGEIPSELELKKFNFLLNSALAIGPRHSASRSIMNAGVSKTKSPHLLPISLAALSGQDGAQDVIDVIRFINKNYQEEVSSVLKRHNFLEIPGVGKEFGNRPVFPTKLISKIEAHCSSDKFSWMRELVESSRKHGLDWKLTGVFAVLCCELQIDEQQVAGLFQFACSPLLIALGAEKSSQQMTSMPFVKDEDYTIG